MFSKTFWKDALERAIKTSAQAVILMLATEGIFEPAELVNLKFDASLLGYLFIALAGFVISIIFSIGSKSFGNKDSASLIK